MGNSLTRLGPPAPTVDDNGDRSGGALNDQDRLQQCNAIITQALAQFGCDLVGVWEGSITPEGRIIINTRVQLVVKGVR